ncbi:hypothetical protein COV06_01640 [Candidatus Uhrbacteria bacterium CG10_big_fil_rev_8_21_14_0_10_50_16]|uniref:Uncharacterized protein n=1 Tax=Candidatus Uhrbacteria bacterium CG10_big_fil_rev_8_21_14_0_10_50_16 TaxID=1975039 RepID=A0A2H0RNG8_9BACT|nr:MAG: hypothetical protein COV06_01640 [Candidatus Uhrbacteria bacterium CG10_big_fil_rev_8_21_14_0_10_50_16]
MATKTKSSSVKKSCTSCVHGCIRCMSKGHVELMVMLLVTVFGLVIVMSISNFRMREQQTVIETQAHQIELLKQ